MNLAFLFVLVIASLAFGSKGENPAAAGSIQVLSFNIRYDNPGDGPHAWANRKDLVAATVRFHKADIAGLQEALVNQVRDLEERLPEYLWVGVGREDGKEKGEFSPIFFRKDRFEAVRSSTFWLSENSARPGSVGWDAALPRIVTWAEVKEKGKEGTFFVFNTHFDHIGKVARVKSSELLIQKIKEIGGGHPVILTGDFNCLESEPPYKILTGESGFRDAYYLAKDGNYGSTQTFQGFREDVRPGERIDFIFVRHAEVIRHGILSERWDGRFVSDHNPVLAEVLLQKEDMEIIFATFAEQQSDLARIQIMIESIRAFAGRFSNAPVWVYLTEGLLASGSEHLEEIESLGGEFRLGRAPEEATWFYLSRKVFASAQAEAEAAEKTDILAWLDVDTVFLQEPGEFLLPKGKSLGYRPVMHRNISPLYSEPLDDFWKRAYENMSVPESRAFRMVTVADGDEIRPYINAGCLIVRPERGLLRKWAETFPLLSKDPVLKEMCLRDERKRIFIHQVALSGAVMKHLGRDEMLELSDRINYPIFFGEMFGSQRSFHDIREAVTIRYENFFDNAPSDWDIQLSGPPHTIAWLKARFKKSDGDIP
jgi:endonuclease/exonuclease/phosphatase family metal-dependent hydrolase